MLGKDTVPCTYLSAAKYGAGEQRSTESDNDQIKQWILDTLTASTLWSETDRGHLPENCQGRRISHSPITVTLLTDTSGEVPPGFKEMEPCTWPLLQGPPALWRLVVLAGSIFPMLLSTLKFTGIPWDKLIQVLYEVSCWDIHTGHYYLHVHGKNNLIRSTSEKS